ARNSRWTRYESRAFPPAHSAAHSAEPLPIRPSGRPSQGRRHCDADDYASLSWTASLGIALGRLGAACAGVFRRIGLRVLSHRRSAALPMSVTEDDDVSRASAARTNRKSDGRLGLLALVLFLIFRNSGFARAVAECPQSK